MRLLLVTSENGWADSLRALFASDDVIAATVSALMQNPALAAAAEACFVAEAQTSPWTVDTLKQLAAVTPAPLFVLADTSRSQWEEAALFAGAEQIFRRPLRAGLLQLAISRCQRRRITEPAAADALARRAVAPREPGEESATLTSWRDFSRLLAHAADGSRLLSEYVAKLRDVLRCARVLLYVPDPQTEAVFRCGYASGVDTTLFESFRLGLRSGLAQLLAERGTVIWLQRLRTESGRDEAAARELAVFGAEVAVPVTGKNGLTGVLLLGPRISGAEYHEADIALVYQAVESIAGLLDEGERLSAHDSSHAKALLNAFPIATALVTSTLQFVDANDAFRAMLGRPDAAQLAVEDLPASWAGALSAAIQNHADSARVELEHRSIGTPRKVRLTVRRVETAAKAKTPFLVTVEDIVPSPGPHDSDPHSIGNLLQRVGEQLSNEFRNALTPIDIMVQLSHDTSTSRGELEQLSTQVGTAIHRLRRRIDDLAYLTKSAIIPEETTVSAVLRSTRERLDEWVDDKHLKRVVWLNEFSETQLMADGRALAVALAELVLNAIEACDGKQVTVTAENSAEMVSFRVRNSGVWAPPPESSGFRHRPFVSSKSTGVGLGVEVASRVAENHGGRLVLGPVAPDTVEAVLRVPRTTTAIDPAKIETRVTRVL